MSDLHERAADRMRTMIERAAAWKIVVETPAEYEAAVAEWTYTLRVLEAVEPMRAALENAQHGLGCFYGQLDHYRPCTCGLNGALRAAREVEQMNDKPSTDRADSASEAEQRMCYALGFDSFSREDAAAFLRAWREAVRELSDWPADWPAKVARLEALEDAVFGQRDNAPQPAAPDDAQTLAVIVGSVADAMEDAGAALNVAESRARHVEKRLMESRVPAQPAPVAHGELSEIARIIARYHEGAGTEPSDEDRAAAREIHAEYERRAAQSESVRELREAWLDWLAFRGRFATGHDVISCICVKCETLRAAIFQTVDNALAKHEAAHE